MAGFTVYPAIDLHLGKVVRLAQGDLERQTVYDDDPAAAARRWLAAGARWLHVVNLDGAFENPDHANRAALEAILAAVQETAPACKVQFGGGMRGMDGISAALGAGVSRAVLGTAAVQSPELVEQALAEYGPDRIAVGLDAKDGVVMVRGWTEDSALGAVDLAGRFEGMGLRTVVFTDIARDGVGSGVNVDRTRSLAEETGLEVIASGGVRTLADIRRVREAGLGGVIIGRSLYEGTVTLEEALEVE